MSRVARQRLLLLRSVNLVWYPVALLPIAALFYLSFTGILSTIVAPLALFFLIFWIVSFGFALATKRRQPPELRQ